MDLSNRQRNLLLWVIESHGDQKRKYTNYDYWTHCYNVAKIAKEYNLSFGVEIGLCHDLLEDTEINEPDFVKALISLGYSKEDSFFILYCVSSLSNKYTAESSGLSRKDRKKLESLRLCSTIPLVQSIKYCDIIDNLLDLADYDKKFSRVYFLEKKNLLKIMNKGHKDLLSRCEKIISENSYLLKLE